jgi:hypothetical protein
MDVICSQWHTQGMDDQLYATSTKKYVILRNILLSQELCNYSTNLISHLISVATAQLT